MEDERDSLDKYMIRVSGLEVGGSTGSDKFWKVDTTE
jgi:hypothetical protein